MQIVAVFLLAASLACALPVDSESCSNIICKIVSRDRLSDLTWPDFADYHTRLLAFYAPAYAAAWLENGQPTAKALAMIALLKGADLKGLKPEDYDANRWDQRIANLPVDHSEFDVELTVCLMRYLADLHYGKANPGFFHLDPKYQDFDIPAFLRTRLMQSADPNGLLAAEVEPPFEGYRRAEQVLPQYLAIAGQSEIKLSDTPATIEPGSEYSELPLLAQRLRQLGDLPAAAILAPDKRVYEDFMVDAVKHFQQRHGLEPDGRIGTATLEQLNTPLSQRVLQLRLSMERWRWIPHTFPHPPIVVNIPEFVLRTLNQSYETDLEMKVVVGSAYETQTPVFFANLTQITFRPYWNVPQSILENEMAAKLAADRDYLSVHRYQVVNATERVIPIPDGLTDAVLKGILNGRYRIRQIPGPDCALGLIRFGIPNENNVYLHDTPSQTLFSMSRRDFSHGCVRVEHPVELAEWCLRETGRWTPARILAAEHGTRTFQVNLKKPVPVLLVYATAIVMKNGEVHFASDIYRQDAVLENRLAQGYPSRTTNGP
jgi:murein L,D-transpeptidase YcbB/YkuD